MPKQLCRPKDAGMFDTADKWNSVLCALNSTMGILFSHQWLSDTPHVWLHGFEALPSTVYCTKMCT